MHEIQPLTTLFLPLLVVLPVLSVEIQRLLKPTILSHFWKRGSLQSKKLPPRIKSNLSGKIESSKKKIYHKGNGLYLVNLGILEIRPPDTYFQYP